eukprot:293145-Chlamydomonas_euryale.AAC.1
MQGLPLHDERMQPQRVCCHPQQGMQGCAAENRQSSTYGAMYTAERCGLALGMADKMARVRTMENFSRY